jgi:ketosteroid isomerase-like protein
VQRLEGSGDLAYVLGTFEIALNCPDADPIEAEGYFQSTHRRQPDNSWLIESIIFSQNPQESEG